MGERGAATAGTRLPGAGGREPHVETMRGLACVLLVLFHVIGEPGSGLGVRPGGALDHLQDGLAYVRMPMFTFLSGYVYALRPIRSDVPRFVRGKARRLLVPMLVIGTVFALTQSAVPGASNDPGPWYLWHVFPVAHFWFLEAVFLVFVVVALLDVRRGLATLPRCAALVAALVALNVAVPAGTSLFAWRNALYLAPFFLAGLAARRFGWAGVRDGAAPWLRPVVAVLAAGTVAWALLGVADVVPRTDLARDPLAFVLGIAVCLSILALRWSWRPLVLVGGFSFTIYTCHVFATSASRIVLTRVGVDTTAVLLVLGLAAGIAAPIVVELLARRSRAGRLLVLGQRG